MGPSSVLWERGLRRALCSCVVRGFVLPAAGLRNSGARFAGCLVGLALDTGMLRCLLDILGRHRQEVPESSRVEHSLGKSSYRGRCGHLKKGWAVTLENSGFGG